MTLAAGARLGPYEILAPLGAGGMGEVYRARDTTLNRDVAIKSLPEAFFDDAERVARFEREAQLLASLNHPHIAAIYGLEQSGGSRFLVLELVDGETLEQRIARGPLPIPDALRISSEVVAALEAAHDKGIVHRDLKPANIALTADGQVKILDFGLAKGEAVGSGGAGRPGDLTHSPTLTFAGTQMGVILGTAAYMSPEQAKGRAADKRSDVWAFGCVLFEMLTGRRAFGGEDIADTLANVLKSEPDWSALPTNVPSHIRDILTRCLDKDRRARIPDMSVVRFLTADASVVNADPRASEGRAGDWRRAAPWAIAGALGLGLIVGRWAPRQKASMPLPRPVTRFSVAAPGGEFSLATSAGPIARSPDGTHVAYVAQSEAGLRQVYVRAMDQLEPSPVRGTEGAGYPFFSPDGQWIGFVSGIRLKKVPVGGGAAFTICEVGIGTRGFSWAPDDTIVYSRQEGLFRVPAAGGAPAQITHVDATDLAQRWPDVLPDGKAVIFTVSRTGDYNSAAIVLLRLDTGERRTLIEGGTYARYVPSGHLVFARAGALLAVPFDLRSLSVQGVPAPVIDRVSMSALNGQGQFAVSRVGTVAYLDVAETFGRNLVWVDRQGAVQPIATPPQNFEQPRLSPDGQRLAVDIRGYAGGSSTDVWLYQFAQGTLMRFTFGHVEAEAPVWTPDGRRITYAVGGVPGRQARAIAWKAADNSGVEELLATGDAHLHPKAWSPRGDVLLSTEGSPGTRSGSADIWALFMNDKHVLQPLAKTPFAEISPGLSPNGRWMTYASDETGRTEVYAQAFPGPGAKMQLSGAGGTEPVWARNGREVFYRNGDKMMALSIDANDAALAPGMPKVLFQGRYVVSPNGDQWYDVSPDGQRFIMLKTQDTQRTSPAITIVQEWSTELARIAPVTK